MKKNYSILISFIALLIISCSSDEDTLQSSSNPDKLLKKITVISGEESDSLQFFYNSKNKLDRIKQSNNIVLDFHYENDVLIEGEFQNLEGVPTGTINKYFYSDDGIVEKRNFDRFTELDERYFYSFNNNHIEKAQYIGYNQEEFSEELIYKYDSNDNVISIIENNLRSNEYQSELSYTYDKKYNPFKNVEPKIALLTEFDSYSNNCISEILTDLSTNEVIYELNYTYEYDNDNYPVSRSDGTDTYIYEYYE